LGQAARTATTSAGSPLKLKMYCRERVDAHCAQDSLDAVSNAASAVAAAAGFRFAFRR
jgi:hypothetical protein